ncbi:sugar transferase [Nakamurella leprariae]|uniref:Sugar transferase n=1 Tax=Nakamurella leprariae TaxID=2803911 RepID=A0A938YGH0_9ACTN|nr:sugar transferase [Nakamurella leprariae]MBM9469153.1 sugar transferase [Nakamurella leprariae]
MTTTPTAPGTGRPPAWLRGYHGVIEPSVLAQWQVSPRDLALSRRSAGTQRLAGLTELPSGTVRSTPSTRTGAHHVGRNGEPAPEPTVPAEPTTPPEPDPVPLDPAAAAVVPPTVPAPVAGTALAAAQWDPAQETLPEFLDRRLAEAPYLYLPNRSRGYAVTKRLIDLVGATVLLIVSAPVILALVVLIRLDSPGPAVFRQQRVTRGGRVFTFYKFRTMWTDARERFPELYDYSRPTGGFDGQYYKLADDPRNTRVGRWLRRTTLDELPNLINVLTGDLSLIGPRPELPDLVPHYRPEELACFFTKAGLTGLAQVAGRSLLTVRERLTLDLRYVANQSLLLDLRILWRTGLVVVLGRGAF